MSNKEATLLAERDRLAIVRGLDRELEGRSRDRRQKIFRIQTVSLFFFLRLHVALGYCKNVTRLAMKKF